MLKIGVLLLMLVKMAKTKKWRETIFPHFKTNKDPEHEDINDSGNYRSGQ
jgi:hypothetical protein